MFSHRVTNLQSEIEMTRVTNGETLKELTAEINTRSNSTDPGRRDNKPSDRK